MKATSRNVIYSNPSPNPQPHRNMLRSISHVSNFKERYYPIPPPLPRNHGPSHHIHPASLRIVVVSFGCPPAVKSMSVSKKFFKKSHAQSGPISKCSCKIAQEIQAGPLWESYISHPFPWHAIFVVTFGCQRPPLVQAVSFSNRSHEVMKLHS